ncbi:integral membrane transport protein [Trypanosoma conorhini]|uniref:Integral membrane transport protein n=1 Tax=Trypanosoma conorhini TaxID=83891 RepID=A0A3R7KS82_9TRYP|nr:integral membrane transport protein [Trypanosoma conorhini]RNF12516.1 integral membrane transport protein [Trypanosoma conorhini]
MGYVSDSFRELGRSTILSVQLSNALIGISAGVEVPLITMVGRKLAYDEKNIAGYVTLTAVFRVLADIPSGMLTECFDMRRLMMGAAFSQAIGCAVALVLKPGPFPLGVFAVMDGVSVGAYFLTRHIYVSSKAKRAHRGIVFSFLAGVLRWSHVVGPLLLGAAAIMWDDEQFYFLVPLLTSLLAGLCILLDGCFCQSHVGGDAHERQAVKEAVTAEEARRLLPVANGATTTRVRVECNGDPVAEPSYAGTAVACGKAACGRGGSLSTPGPAPPPQEAGCGQPRAHADFGVWALCTVIVEFWSTIWRLGGYILLYVSLRANRKLLLTFAAMRMNFTNSELAFLLSFSFAFDALLFPLGGIILDVYGHRWSMVAAVLGLGVNFMLLPLVQSPLWLYAMAAAFGSADALGCGLLLTLIADSAPVKLGGTFFGVMRTVQDMGHVLGAMVVSVIINQVDFVVCCYVWWGASVLAALWAWFISPATIR